MIENNGFVEYSLYIVIKCFFLIYNNLHDKRISEWLQTNQEENMKKKCILSFFFQNNIMYSFI